MSTILCVGSADHVRSAAAVLSEAGYDAVVVDDAETARSRAAEAVDCVVTALDLPAATGPDVGSALGVPTIVCAADGDERTAARVLAAGCEGYVPAADVEGVLVPQVRAVLQNVTATRESAGESSAHANPVDDRTTGGSSGPSEESVPADAGLRDADRGVIGAVDPAAIQEFLAATTGVATDDAAADAAVPEQVRRAQTLEALHWIAEDTFDAGSRDAVAERVAQAGRRVLGADLAAVYLPGDDGLEPVAASGVEPGDLPVARAESEPGCGRSEAPDARADGATSSAVDGSGRFGERAADRDVLAVPDARSFPAETVEGFRIGDRGLLCLGVEADGVDAWTGKLADLLGAAADAALERERRSRRLRGTATVVEAVDACLLVLDADDRIVHVDDALVVLRGAARDEVVDEPLAALLDEDGARRAREAVAAVRDDGSTSEETVQVDLQTRRGEPVPCELTFRAVPETADRVVGVLRNVVERERAIERLRTAEAKVERLHDAVLELEADQSVEAVYETAVDAASDVLDADRCWIVERDGESFEPQVARGDGDAGTVTWRRVAQHLAAPALAAGRTEVDGHRHARRLDERDADRDVEYRSAVAVPLDDETVLQAVARPPTAFDDVDVALGELLVAHVAATRERLEYQADLRRERDRIAALFDNVPNPVVRTRIEDDRALVEAVNPSFERVFGFETDEIVGEVLDDHIVPPDRVDRAQELTRRGLEGEIVETEVQRLTATGTRDFLLTVVPISDDGGPAVNYAVYTDITERKQRQQRLEVLNRVLRHDLRNGMNVVRGSAELLEETVDGDATQHVAAIEERAAEMIDLADKTRTIQRILETNPGDVGPVDVVDAVEQAIDRLELPADAAVETTTPYRARARVGTLLPLAIRHVLENAVLHHDGSPSIEVEVRERSAERTVEVVVADDGPGIPEHERALVTEQREITQLRHGSGLGLWIVNWVVTGCGGELEIERREPRGTVVRMCLPQAGADRTNLPVLLD